MAIMTEGEYRYNQLIKIFKSEPEPGFESAEQQELVWGQRWGCDNDVGRLRVVLVHRPGAEVNIVDTKKRLEGIGAFGDPAQGWYWRGSEGPDLPAMQAQHDKLVALLKAEGVRVESLDSVAPGKMKSCYTRDSCVAVEGGAIITRMGPPIRRGEEMPVLKTLARLGMPVLRTVHGTGIFEGGSFARIDKKTAVVGVSSRVNEEGTRQVEEVLRAQGVGLIRVHLTGYRLHIDGTFVMVDVDTALINPTQLPFWFLDKLKEMKIRTIEVCHEDPVSTVNCLAVRPGRIIMSSGVSQRTLDALDKAGVTVLPLDYEKVYSGGGGIHCSTAPLLRDPVE
jgi:N-dimethylarginine dimethylaminohydrolase